MNEESSIIVSQDAPATTTTAGGGYDMGMPDAEPRPGFGPGIPELMILLVIVAVLALHIKMRIELAISRGLRPALFTCVSFIPIYGTYRLWKTLISPSADIKSEIEQLKQRTISLENNQAHTRD